MTATLDTHRMRSTHLLKPMDECRRSCRFACVLPGSLEGAPTDLPMLAKVVNLSTVGIGIHVSEPIQPDTELSLTLYLRNGEIVTPLHVRVVHATRQFNGTWIMGAAFDAPLADAELLAYLS
jgi:hypothetical protein